MFSRDYSETAGNLPLINEGGARREENWEIIVVTVYICKTSLKGTTGKCTAN
jgi:hypothetical protein